jgi:hypothetical protein
LVALITLPEMSVLDLSRADRSSMIQADEEGTASGQRYEPLARRGLDAYELEATGLTLIGYDWNYTFRVERQRERPTRWGASPRAASERR